MAKVKESAVRSLTKKTVSRPGIHAKTKQSKNKNSKNYKKVSVGQG